MPAECIAVTDHGRTSTFTFEQMLAYHGPGSPAGVAHAFKVLELGLPLLASEGHPERREIEIRTAFGGPGARDGFELVTRAVTEDRYTVDPALERPELGRTRERFVFNLSHRGRSMTLTLREGYVTDEFLDLARKERTPSEEDRLAALKLEMTDLLMSREAVQVYDVSIA